MIALSLLVLLYLFIVFLLRDIWRQKAEADEAAQPPTAAPRRVAASAAGRPTGCSPKPAPENSAATRWSALDDLQLQRFVDQSSR